MAVHAEEDTIPIWSFAHSTTANILCKLNCKTRGRLYRADPKIFSKHEFVVKYPTATVTISDGIIRLVLQKWSLSLYCRFLFSIHPSQRDKRHCFHRKNRDTVDKIIIEDCEIPKLDNKMMIKMLEFCSTTDVEINNMRIGSLEDKPFFEASFAAFCQAVKPKTLRLEMEDTRPIMRAFEEMWNYRIGLTMKRFETTYPVEVPFIRDEHEFTQMDVVVRDSVDSEGLMEILLEQYFEGNRNLDFVKMTAKSNYFGPAIIREDSNCVLLSKYGFMKFYPFKSRFEVAHYRVTSSDGERVAHSYKSFDAVVLVSDERNDTVLSKFETLHSMLMLSTIISLLFLLFHIGLIVFKGPDPSSQQNFSFLLLLNLLNFIVTGLSILDFEMGIWKKLDFLTISLPDTSLLARIKFFFNCISYPFDENDQFSANISPFLVVCINWMIFLADYGLIVV